LEKKNMVNHVTPTPQPEIKPQENTEVKPQGNAEVKSQPKADYDNLKGKGDTK
jgi:hypothetical protein